MAVRWTICAILAAFGVVISAPQAWAQDAGAVVFAEAKEIEEEDQKLIQLDVQIRDVDDLGAFVFVLTFKGDLLEVDRVERGEFLGSSEREVNCLEPTIEPNALQYTCVTLGETPREGATGEGRLATVFFNVKGDGESNLQFTRARLLTPPGDEIPTEWQSGIIDVKGGDGMGWVLYALIAGGVIAVAVVLGAVLALMQRSRRRADVGSYGAEGE